MLQIISEAQTFRKIGVEDGLPSSIVYDIKVDKNGIVWIGTYGGGVCRYDGKTFKTLNQANGLSSDLIRRLSIDNETNRVYVAAQGALEILTKDSVINITSTLLDTLHNQDVAFLSGTYKMLYAGTGNNITVFKNGQKFFTIPNVELPSDYFIDENNNHVFCGRKGLTVRQPNGEVYNYNKKFNTNIVWLTAVTMFNNFHVISSAKGIYVFKGLNLIKHITANKTLTNDVISCMYVDKANTLWLGTKTGLFYTKDLETFYPLGKKNGFEESEVKCITPDLNGDLWIGTNGNGIFKMINSNVLNYGLNEKPIDLFVASKKDIYVLTKRSVLKFNSDSDRFVLYKSLANLTAFEPKRVCLDENQTLYVSCDKGVVQFNKGSPERVFLPAKINQKQNTPLDLYYHNNTIWMTFKRTILKYDITKNKVDTLKENKEIKSSWFQNVCSDKKNNIWITTSKSVLKINQDSVKEFFSKTTDNVKSVMANYICADIHNNIWVAQDNGLFCIEPNNYIGKNTKKTGFVTNELFGLASLDSFMFTGSNKGLVQVTIKKRNNRSNSFIIINSSRGLTNSDLTSGEIAADSTSIWVLNKHANMLYRYKPNNKVVLSEKINLFISDVFKDSVSYAFRNSKNYIQTFVDLNTPLYLKHNENDFTISFIGINYRQFEGNLYKYRLVGLSDKWSIPDKETKAVFTNLSPGEYRFELCVSRSNGTFQSPVHLTIIISSPFYKSGWFISLMILLGGLLIYWFIQIRTKSIKKQNVVLEQKVTERTLQLNYKTEELIKNNHLLVEKNRLIFESLEYSKKIQESILPSADYLEKQFSGIVNTASLYIPKDIVSGDFYYTNKKNDLNYFAVVDCTGHGVPGALLSFSVNSILHGIIDNDKHRKMPSDVLKKLVGEFNDIYIKGQDVKESFTVSLICYDKTKQKVSYSAISQSILVLNNNGEAVEMKSSVSFLQQGELDILDQEFSVEKGTRIFLYSDGYYDQKNEKTGKRMFKNGLLKRVAETRHLPLTEQLASLKASFIAYRGDAKQIDDATVFAIEIV